MSRPIEQVEAEIGAEYFEICERWLKERECSIEKTGGNKYLVHFPAGSREEGREGLVWLYSSTSYIVLPSGVEIPKLVAEPLNSTQTRRVTLGFPADIFPNPSKPTT